MAFDAGDPQRRGGDIPAVLTGLAAAVGGAFVWALIAYLSKQQFEIAAVLMGVLVGAASGWLRPASVAGPAASAILAVFGCALGSFLALVFVVVGRLGYSLGWVAAHLNILLRTYPHTVGGMNLLFWAIAGVIGFRIAFGRMRPRGLAAGPGAGTPPWMPPAGYGAPVPPGGYAAPPPAPGYGSAAPGYGTAPPPAPGYGSAAPGYGTASPADPPGRYDGPGFALPPDEPPRG